MKSNKDKRRDRRRLSHLKRKARSVRFVNWLLKSNVRRILDDGLAVRYRVNCRDGFSVSIQAGSRFYCTPRINGGPWTEVELGYPSAHPGRRIAKHGECMHKRMPTKTIYSYVPVQLVHDLIRKHGGVA